MEPHKLLSRYAEFITFGICIAICGCSPLEPYRVSEEEIGYAIVEDRPKRFGFQSDHIRIVSVDRQQIDSDARGVPAPFASNHDLSSGHPKNFILVESGLRKLEVEICEFLPNIINVLGGFVGGISSWECGHAVIRLEADAGTHYRICGLLNKKEDFAEIWIENAQTARIVTEPIRIDGLY